MAFTYVLEKTLSLGNARAWVFTFTSGNNATGGGAVTGGDMDIPGRPLYALATVNGTTLPPDPVSATIDAVNDQVDVKHTSLAEAAAADTTVYKGTVLVIGVG